MGVQSSSPGHTRVLNEELRRWIGPLAETNGLSMEVRNGPSQVRVCVYSRAFSGVTRLKREAGPGSYDVVLEDGAETTVDNRRLCIGTNDWHTDSGAYSLSHASARFVHAVTLLSISSCEYNHSAACSIYITDCERGAPHREVCTALQTGLYLAERGCRLGTSCFLMGCS